MEVKKSPFQNGTKLLSVIDRLSCQNENNYRLIPELGNRSKTKDDKSDNLRTRRKEGKSTIQNMDSKRQSKFPNKSILKLKENRFGEFSDVINLNEYPYEQMSKGGLPIPPNVQLTLKPGIPKGAKPSLCFCKPPTKTKSNNEGINQKNVSVFNSGIQSKEISHTDGKSKNGTINQQDYSDFYFEILSKESSRASVIQYASCLSNDKNLNDEQIDNKQRGGKQVDDTKIFDDKEVDDIQIINKQKVDKQKDDQQKDDKQINNKQVDDGQIHDQIDQETISDVKEQIKTTDTQKPKEAAKHSSTCGICLQKFPSVLSLEQHRKENGHYLCSECGEALQDDAAFREHQNKKLCKKAICIFCGQKFITRDELENHKTVVHHKCLECNKLYTSADKLLSHNERHHGAPYICLQCGQEFPTHASCKKHAMTRHKKKKYCCPECGKGFTRMNLLNRHATYTHSDDRNFQCEICSKTFKRPDALKIHMITHSDSKPFHCEKCGKQFNQKICYTKHLPCRQRRNQTKSKNNAPITMVDNLDKLSENSEIFENTNSATLPSESVGMSLDKFSENNLIEIFENVSSASLGNAVRESVGSSMDEEIYMGCRCPPSCRCKKFSIGLKVETEEPKGPSLDAVEEIASLPCCCDIGLDFTIFD